jgi:outer membrane protein OmpA-like peptidoglycan-associated protein
MVWKIAALLIASCLAFAGAAKADVTPVCFDPGTARLSPDGYRALRSLAAEQGGTRAHAHIRLFTGGKAQGVVAERLVEARLELANNDVFYGRIETVETGQPVPEDCVAAEVAGRDGADRTPPYMALWHYYGPYFEQGSAEVTPPARESLRFIVAGYRPGEIRYCIGGHSDTEADARTSMALSLQRAENVALELVRQGVRWDDTEIRAYGETQLARPTADGVAEPLNRRVFVDVRQTCPAAPR